MTGHIEADILGLLRRPESSDLERKAAGEIERLGFQLAASRGECIIADEQIDRLRAGRDGAEQKWLHAPAIPKELEGRQAWQWNASGGGRPFISRIPCDYSRNAAHAGGVWFMLIETPHWPSVEMQQAAERTLDRQIA